MINIRWVVVICLVVTLVGCGGGGGGGASGITDSSQTQEASSEDGGTASSGDSPGSENVADSGGSSGGALLSPLTNDKEAVITFPATTSVATKSTVTVKGFARDIDGISEVLVNGVPATLTVLSSTTSSKATSKAASSKPSSAVSQKTEAGQDVQWEAQITVSPGDNDISVSVTDEQGNTTEELDRRSVSYLDVPIEFSLDESMTRVIGISTNAFAGFARSLVDYDYVNLQQNVLSESFDSAGPSCYKADTSEFFHLVFGENNSLLLHSYDLDTETDNLVMTKQVDPAGEGFVDGVHINNMTCGAGNDSVYLLINYFATDNSGLAKSTILEFDLADEEVRILSETDTSAPSPWISREITLTDTILISQGGLSNSSPLMAVDLNTGSRSELTPGLNVGALALASGSTEDIIYAATFDGVDEIDSSAGTAANKSVVDDTDPFVFSQVRKAAYDKANNRVIVSDSDLDALIAVDLATGERSELLGRSIGTGNKMIAPRAVQFSSDGSKAYVADDGGNAPEKLFVVDLATGNRTLLGDINLPYNTFVAGLALDEANDQIFVAFSDTILQVDLTTAKNTVVASDSIGAGVVIEGISDLLFDADNQRLIAADAGSKSLFAVDLSTLERTVISSESAKGEGEPFDGVNSMAFSNDKTRVYVSNQASENIMSVDLASGNREIILHECLNDEGVNVLGVDTSLHQVLLDPTRNRLLIQVDDILGFDLDSQSCRVLQPFPSISSILALAFNASEQLFALTFKALGQYDLDSGEYVIVSK